MRRPGQAFAALVFRDGPRCYLCGQGQDPDDRLEIEHVKPRSARGSDELTNLRLAHSSCNKRKGIRAVPA